MPLSRRGNLPSYLSSDLCLHSPRTPAPLAPDAAALNRNICIRCCFEPSCVEFDFTGQVAGASPHFAGQRDRRVRGTCQGGHAAGAGLHVRRREFSFRVRAPTAVIARQPSCLFFFCFQVSRWHYLCSVVFTPLHSSLLVIVKRPPRTAVVYARETRRSYRNPNPREVFDESHEGRKGGSVTDGRVDAVLLVWARESRGGSDGCCVGKIQAVSGSVQQFAHRVEEIKEASPVLDVLLLKTTLVKVRDQTKPTHTHHGYLIYRCRLSPSPSPSPSLSSHSGSRRT